LELWGSCEDEVNERVMRRLGFQIDWKFAEESGKEIGFAVVEVDFE
jgi:hypothetical protein